MRFGGDMYVFPGGRMDPDDSDHAAAAIRETFEETGIRLDPASLIPISRWVTPPGLPSRYDARFFAAFVPPGTDVVAASEEVADWRWLRPADALEAMAEGDLAMWQPTLVTLQQLAASEEVADWRWLRPADALEAMAEGDLAMWQPTLVTLQQLDGLEDRAAVEAAFRSGEGEMKPSLATVGSGLIRVKQPWAAGIQGRVEPGWLVGHEEWVFVNPSDPTGLTSDAAVEAARAAGARIVAVAITDLDPFHHAGVEMFAAGLALPVIGGRGTARLAPYPVSELGDGEAVPFGDVRLVARLDPGPGRRPEALRFTMPGWSLPERASEAAP